MGGNGRVGWEPSYYARWSGERAGIHLGIKGGVLATQGAVYIAFLVIRFYVCAPACNLASTHLRPLVWRCIEALLSQTMITRTAARSVVQVRTPAGGRARAHPELHPVWKLPDMTTSMAAAIDQLQNYYTAGPSDEEPIDPITVLDQY